MNSEFHILNGDCLKQMFPQSIGGEIIVVREAFVDGDISSGNLDELFKKRSKFISEQYGVASVEKYYEDSVSEFNRIINIPNESEINLWFEDDLFCQVNFWFVAHLIVRHNKEGKYFLVRPDTHTPYGFGGLNNKELIQIYKQRCAIDELVRIGSLWDCFQRNELEELENTGRELARKHPYILKAIIAFKESIPSQNSLGRPLQTLVDLMNELNTDSFPLLFEEFNSRESIYGYGDLQVKRLLDQLKDRKKEVNNE